MPKSFKNEAKGLEPIGMIARNQESRMP